MWENEAKRIPNEAGTKQFSDDLGGTFGKTKQNGSQTERERSSFMKDSANRVGKRSRTESERSGNEALL